MPLTGDAKRNYQRQKMSERRAKTETGSSPITPEVIDVARAAKATNVTSVGTDFGGEHYWGAVSKAPEGMRICTAFQFGTRMIGGCGKIVPWEGKPIPTNVNSEPELAQAIIDSPFFKEIQSKMPLTKTRG